MLINREIREDLNELFFSLKLKDKNENSSLDKQVKIEQIIAYLEIIHSEIRRTSRKRKLVFLDSGAGNCYLSYLVYYYYQHINSRNIEIHCIDHNEKLMEKNRQLAQQMGFTGMFFHASDINDINIDSKVDLVYSLHACDTATDKTQYLAVRHNARILLSVSCCQHSISTGSKMLRSVTRHKSYKEKILMMVADSLRALLLEKQGYKVDIFDFVSSRYTDKNIMLRAIRKESRKTFDPDTEYRRISSEFKIKPYLEELLA